MFLLSVFTVLALGPSGSPPAAANHAISGRVSDSAGTALANVRIVVLEANRSTQTDAGGRYRIPNLPDGTYGVSFSYVGYAPVVRRVSLSNQDLTVDVILRQSLIELPPLQVTATPLATTVLTSPQPTAVVAGTELRTAQAPTLGETLSSLAGVHSLSTGVGIGKPVIRGLTSNRVLVLDNGQRLETQQWGDEHGPNVETATAERIEVIRGPASVLYGSDALGGVINVVQRDLPEAGRLHGSLTAAYSSNNRQPDGALLVEGAGAGFGLRATLSGRTSKDLKTPDYTLWNSGNEAIAGSGTAGVRGGWGSLTGTFSQRNEKVFLTDEDPAATPTQRIATSRGRIDLTLPMGRSRLEGNLGYERNRRREFEDKETAEVALGLLSQTWTGAAQVHHAPLGNLAGIVGVSGLRNRFSKFGTETLIPNSTAYTLGAYVFEQLEAGRWIFSFGARADHRHLDVEDDAELGVQAQTRNWNSLTGNLGALFHVTEPVALVLNVGRGYRAPSSFDLFSNGVHEGTVAFEHGNPSLKNETSLNTDLALRVQSSKVFLELGGFANFIEDFIYSVPTGTTDPESGFEIFDVTQGNARLAGFEASLQYHPIAALHFQGTADYTNGQNTSTGNPLPLIPPFRATYSLRFEGRSRGSLSNPYLLVGGESNGKQTRMDPAEAAFYAEAFDGAGYQSKAYTLANAGAGLGILAGSGVVRLDLTLRNAFNQRYANYLSRIKTTAIDPGMGRNLTLKLSTDF
ncbi:MAG TPA: TonB-dependent receptor [Gemmatimonadales bacterium]|jgi:iron complex outermembrane receptor protein|nr:TonB-dependent receptor [Gemmatimonadales bacterium]